MKIRPSVTPAHAMLRITAVTPDTLDDPQRIRLKQGLTWQELMHSLHQRMNITKYRIRAVYRLLPGGDVKARIFDPDDIVNGDNILVKPDVPKLDPAERERLMRMYERGIKRERALEVSVERRTGIQKPPSKFVQLRAIPAQFSFQNLIIYKL